MLNLTFNAPELCTYNSVCAAFTDTDTALLLLDSICCYLTDRWHFDWLMMTDAFCVSLEMIFGSGLLLLYSVCNIIHHIILVRPQILESYACQGTATSYRKTVNPFVFLNILSLGVEKRVETSLVNFEHIFRWMKEKKKNSTFVYFSTFNFSCTMKQQLNTTAPHLFQVWPLWKQRRVRFWRVLGTQRDEKDYPI